MCPHPFDRRTRIPLLTATRYVRDVPIISFIFDERLTIQTFMLVKPLNAESKTLTAGGIQRDISGESGCKGRCSKRLPQVVARENMLEVFTQSYELVSF